MPEAEEAERRDGEDRVPQANGELDQDRRETFGRISTNKMYCARSLRSRAAAT